MNSFATPQFWKLYDELPESVQELADKAYHLWVENPDHPGLQFKKIKGHDRLYSVRINLDWRALGILKEDGIHWF
jgi:hypothetical protein